MPAAKLIKSLFILCLAPVSECKAQDTRQTNQEYHIERLKRKTEKSTPYVLGQVFHGSNGSLIPWPGASIIFDKKKVLVSDNDGRYVLLLQPGEHTIICTYVGCNVVRIEGTKLNPGDSIKIVFYLHDTPMNLR